MPVLGDWRRDRKPTHGWDLLSLGLCSGLAPPVEPSCFPCAAPTLQMNSDRVVLLVLAQPWGTGAGQLCSDSQQGSLHFLLPSPSLQMGTLPRPDWARLWGDILVLSPAGLTESSPGRLGDGTSLQEAAVERGFLSRRQKNVRGRNGMEGNSDPSPKPEISEL